MSNSWLRLWHDMPTDPKFRTISKVSKQPLCAVIALYTFLLVDASASSERGVTQCDAEDVASALDMEIEQVEAIKKAMQGRVLDGSKLKGWERRQPKREDNSSERTRTYRERKAAQELNVTQCDARERNVTLDKDTDKDKDKEDKKKPTTSVVVKKEKFKLPENFCVTDHHRKLAQQNGWPSPDDELEAFRDHHIAKANRFADWDRAFYMWLRNGKSRFVKTLPVKIDTALHAEIKKIFCETLPVNPINQWPRQAEKDLQMRIDEDPRRKCAIFWHNFFTLVKCSGSIKSHEWHLDYLVRDQTFANILNGKRHTETELANYQKLKIEKIENKAATGFQEATPVGSHRKEAENSTIINFDGKDLKPNSKIRPEKSIYMHEEKNILTQAYYNKE